MLVVFVYAFFSFVVVLRVLIKLDDNRKDRLSHEKTCLTLDN